jgi:hypothetical protein
MTLKRQPYQAPELILLGVSAKDTANPQLKGLNSTEYSNYLTAYRLYVHGGPHGQFNRTYGNRNTPTVS